MKPQSHFARISAFIFTCLISLNNTIAQDFCDGTTGIEGSSRNHFGCPDLDELTAEEVQAMPIMYIPVVFHFKAYRDSLTNRDVNFICDKLDTLYSVNTYLYAPKFVFKVMEELNLRMSDQLLEDPEGDPNSDQFDTRIRYYLHNGPDWTTLPDTPDCTSFNFYASNQPIGSLSNDAVHLIFLDNGAINSTTGKPATGGQVAGTRRIEIKNFARAYYKDTSNVNTWAAGRIGNHEVGHLFHLDHTWNCNNICRKSTIHPDYPIDPVLHCCDTCFLHNGLTNGVCGTGTCANIQSPFLMAEGYLTVTLCEHRIWWSTRGSSTPYPVIDFCNDSSRVDTLIYDTSTKLEWTGQRYINADVIIKNGTEVEITCEVFMGKDKAIFVERS